ncbi:diguanylate cyclase [Thermodesulfobacteriota bacterium]
MNRAIKSNPHNTFLAVAKSWLGIVFAVIGGLAVAFGLFEDFSNLLFIRITLATLVLLIAAFEGYLRYKGQRIQRYHESITGPLLWTVLVWMACRSVLPLAGHILLLPAIFTAWLVVSFPLKTIVPSLLLMISMEGGLIGTGHQPLRLFILNLILYGAAITALSLYTDSKAYRRSIRKSLAKAKKEAGTEEQARDFGLLEIDFSLKESLERPNGLDAPQDYRSTVESITASFNIQLEILRKSLGLNTVALLSVDQAKGELRLRNLATIRHDILPGPYDIGGVVGALRVADKEVTMAPAKGGAWHPPYYRNRESVGGLYAITIEDDFVASGSADKKEITVFLCADRDSEAPWEETDRKTLRLAARKLSLELSMSRQLLVMDQERDAMQRVCIGLRELNSVLGLDHVFDATFKVIKTLIPADCIALSLAEGERHIVVRAEGASVSHLEGSDFPINDGLVGQALKLGSTVPPTSQYRGPAPIFSNTDRIGDFRSLLIVPLFKEEGERVGALTVAAQKPGIFTRAKKDILELIAAQIAIKIDLGQSHEKINKLATTDGLTELANHRTFQHGFDMMLERARRQETHLCLLLCDIDHFKQVNDTYGHPFGDQVLKSVAGILAGTVRTVDLVARYGGEEFGIILEGSDAEGGRLMAERIRLAVEDLTVHKDGRAVSVTLSLGLSVFPADGAEKDTLISLADQALYQAKQGGRNQVVAWSGT